MQKAESTARGSMCKFFCLYTVCLSTVLVLAMQFVFIEEKILSPLQRLAGINMSSIDPFAFINKDKDKMPMVPSSYRATFIPGIEASKDVKVISTKPFSELVSMARKSDRKRRMVDLTQNPTQSSMQVLVNTWTEGSYSPVHKHEEYGEAFVIMEGALAFFTFDQSGSEVICTVLDAEAPTAVTDTHVFNRAVIVEKNTFHAMCAAPKAMGYPGHAIIFENSGHTYDASKNTKVYADFAPVGDGLNGDDHFFLKLLNKCPRKQTTE